MELWKIECSQHTHCTQKHTNTGKHTYTHTNTHDTHTHIHIHTYTYTHTHTRTRECETSTQTTDTEVMRLVARSIENNIYYIYLYSCSHHYQLRDIRTHALAIISTQLKYYLPIKYRVYRTHTRTNVATDL